MFGKKNDITSIAKLIKQLSDEEREELFKQFSGEEAEEETDAEQPEENEQEQTEEAEKSLEVKETVEENGSEEENQEEPVEQSEEGETEEESVDRIGELEKTIAQLSDAIKALESRISSKEDIAEKSGWGFDMSENENEEKNDRLEELRKKYFAF